MKSGLSGAGRMRHRQPQGRTWQKLLGLEHRQHGEMGAWQELEMLEHRRHGEMGFVQVLEHRRCSKMGLLQRLA